MKDQIYDLPKKAKTFTSNVHKLNAYKGIDKDLSRIEAEYKRGYEAAEAGRLLSDWRGSSSHVNDEILKALRTLRSRSRELYQNNAIVQNYFQILDTNIIGGGFKFKALTSKKNELITKNNDLIENKFLSWCGKKTCDIAGKNSFKSMLSLIIATIARDGEALIIKHRTKPNKINPFGFSLQLMNVDNLDIDYNIPFKNGVAIVMGVELDEFGRVLAYHLNTNENRQQTTTKIIRRRIPAEDVYHIFYPEFVEQVRGVPWLHSVMKPLHQLAKLEEYVLVAMRVGASTMGFLMRDADATGGAEQLADGEDELGNLVIDAEPGVFEALPPGWRVETFKPDFPAQSFEALIKTYKRGISNGLRIGYNTLYNDLEGVTYSSIRAGTISEREMFKNYHGWLIDSFISEVYIDFVKEAFKNNVLIDDETGYRIPDQDLIKLITQYKFNGRSWQWVDPSADIDAAIKAKDNGIYSPVRIAEMMGEDVWEQMRETAAVRDEAKRLNIFIENINDPLAAEQAQAQADALAAAQEKAQAQHTETQQAKEKELNLINLMQRDLNTNLNNKLVDVNNSIEHLKNNQKSSDINVNPHVNVEAPIINVNMASKKIVKTVAQRDERGLITSVESIIEDAPEEDLNLNNVNNDINENINIEELAQVKDELAEEIKQEEAILNIDNEVKEEIKEETNLNDTL